MTYATCIFCNRNDSKPSKEDVLARWIAREFPNERWEVKDHETNLVFQTRRGSLGLISKKPCQRCNNTWMSNLEQVARPILVPLMNGTPSVLTPDRQLIIVRWFIKTVIVYELLNKRPCYFEQSERHALMRSLTVPADTNFFLARYVGPEPLATRELLVPLVRRGPRRTNTDLPTEIMVYAVTFSIKELALQLISCRRPQNFRADISVPIPGRLNDATVQIWPIKSNVAWPPRLPLNDIAFDQFSSLGT